MFLSLRSFVPSLSWLIILILFFAIREVSGTKQAGRACLSLSPVAVYAVRNRGDRIVEQVRLTVRRGRKFKCLQESKRISFLSAFPMFVPSLAW